MSKPYRYLKHFLRKSPIVLIHNITYRCNLHCTFCDLWKKKNTQAELTTEEIKGVLRQAAKLGIINYSVTGGEPLLRPDLAEGLAYAKKLGFYILLVTNGTLLTKRIADIAPYVDLLAVSLEALDERHSELRGVKNTLERVLEGLDTARRYPIAISLNCTLNSQTIDQIDTLLEFSKEKEIGIGFEPLYNYGEVTDLTLDQSTLHAAVKKILSYKHKNGYFITTSEKYLRLLLGKDSFQCVGGSMVLRLSPFGEVLIPGCYWTPLLASVGSLREHPLKTLWYSKEAYQARKMMLECSDCSVPCYVEPSLTRKDLRETFYLVQGSYALKKLAKKRAQRLNASENL
ncbi:MAG: radical SAM/SPASM domain-containing protein [Promethearchaeota archaeon]